MFLRRISPNPHNHDGPAFSPTLAQCPDIWELQSGDFAIIGTDQTDTLSQALPPTAGCGPHERIVVIPRYVLTAARKNIPKT